MSFLQTYSTPNSIQQVFSCIACANASLFMFRELLISARMLRLAVGFIKTELTRERERERQRICILFPHLRARNGISTNVTSSPSRCHLFAISSDLIVNHRTRGASELKTMDSFVERTRAIKFLARISRSRVCSKQMDHFRRRNYEPIQYIVSVYPPLWLRCVFELLRLARPGLGNRKIDFRDRRWNLAGIVA